MWYVTLTLVVDDSNLCRPSLFIKVDKIYSGIMCDVASLKKRYGYFGNEASTRFLHDYLHGLCCTSLISEIR